MSNAFRTPSDRRAKLVRATPRGAELGYAIAREFVAETERAWTDPPRPSRRCAGSASCSKS